MSSQQRLEGGLVARADEAVEKRAVGQMPDRRRSRQFADVAQDHAELHFAHSRASPGTVSDG